MVTTGVVGTAGLIFDIIGAFFLANQFVVMSGKEAAQATRMPYRGTSPSIQHSAVQQAMLGKVGFALLVLGFLLQSMAYSDWFQPGRVPRRASGGLLGAVVVLLMAWTLVYQRRRKRSENP